MTRAKAPGMSLQTLETVRAGLCERRQALGNWEAVAAEIGVSLGTTKRVADGYEPRNPDLRAKFGLPRLMPAPVCPIHGVVHQTKRCPRPAFSERVVAYDAWRAANMGKLLAIVKWAETRPAERVWPINA